jgi:hypothetical protein
MRGAGINTIGGRVQVLELDVPLPIASDEVLIAVKTARSQPRKCSRKRSRSGAETGSWFTAEAGSPAGCGLPRAGSQLRLQPPTRSRMGVQRSQP